MIEFSDIVTVITRCSKNVTCVEWCTSNGRRMVLFNVSNFMFSFREGARLLLESYFRKHFSVDAVMNGVTCRGDEANLLDCPFLSLKNSPCDSGSKLAVACGKLYEPLLKFIKFVLHFESIGILAYGGHLVPIEIFAWESFSPP